MKANLEIMYLKKKSDLRLILAVGLICTSFFCVIQYSITYVFKNKLPTVVYLSGSYGGINSIEEYLIIISLFIHRCPFFLYGLLTVRDIDFKLYM